MHPFINRTMKIPQDLHYTPEHLWVRTHEDGVWEAGITDYAQDLLGDIVFVEAPRANTQLTQGVPCGLVESVKTGSDLHAPLDGLVTAMNTDLDNAPEAINDQPYKSWIFKFKPKNATELSTLLSAEDYAKTLVE